MPLALIGAEYTIPPLSASTSLPQSPPELYSNFPIGKDSRAVYDNIMAKALDKLFLKGRSWIEGRLPARADGPEGSAPAAGWFYGLNYAIFKAA